MWHRWRLSCRKTTTAKRAVTQSTLDTLNESCTTLFAGERLNLVLLNSFHCVKSGEVIRSSRGPVRKSARCYGLQTGFVASSFGLNGVEAVNDKK